jgi:hypothetical protein
MNLYKLSSFFSYLIDFQRNRKSERIQKTKLSSLVEGEQGRLLRENFQSMGHIFLKSPNPLDLYLHSD